MIAPVTDELALNEASMCEKCCSPSDALAYHAAPSLSRRAMLGLAVASSTTVALGAAAWAKDTTQTKAPPKPQNVLTPDASLARLMAGNARYVGGVSKRHDFAHEREALAGGQNPWSSTRR
jgi:carbonic anhydrase